MYPKIKKRTMNAKKLSPAISGTKKAKSVEETGKIVYGYNKDLSQFITILNFDFRYFVILKVEHIKMFLYGPITLETNSSCIGIACGHDLY